MEKDDRKPFRLSFHLEQMKSLNLLSRLIPYLSVFVISDNYASVNSGRLFIR